MKSVFYEIDFLSILNLVFTACVACKNQVQNRQKIKFKNQFREIEILKNQVQIDKGLTKDSMFSALPLLLLKIHLH